VCVPELPNEPADFVPYLESLNLFEATQFSAEDRKRADFYRAESERASEVARFTSVDQYLDSLSMEATFEPFDGMHLPRITQLVQRTNQFNLTTIRHSAEEITQFADDPAIVSYYVTLADKFGDSGLISVVIARREGDLLDIVTWLMSCRVVARRLEEFVLDRLVELAREAGMRRLSGRYVPTAKNGLVAGHYERLGFRPVEERHDGSTTWELSVADYVPSGAPIERRAVELGSSGDLGQAAGHI
jgi:FkbH-like protein